MEKSPNSPTLSDKSSYFKTIHTYASVIQKSAFQELCLQVGQIWKLRKGTLLQGKKFDSEQQWKYFKIATDMESLSYLLMEEEEERNL